MRGFCDSCGKLLPVKTNKFCYNCKQKRNNVAFNLYGPNDADKNFGNPVNAEAPIQPSDNRLGD